MNQESPLYHELPLNQELPLHQEPRALGPHEGVPHEGVPLPQAPGAPGVYDAGPEYESGWVYADDFDYYPLPEYGAPQRSQQFLEGWEQFEELPEGEQGSGSGSEDPTDGDAEGGASCNRCEHSYSPSEELKLTS